MKLCSTLAAFAAAACLSPAGTEAFAEGHPSRPITWVVPFTPDGIADSGARVIAKALSECFADNGQVRLVGWTKDKFDLFIDKEMVKWEKLIEMSGAKAF